MVDAANAFASDALSQTPGDALPPLAPGQIYVKNTTGASRNRYEALALSALSTSTLAKSTPDNSTNVRYTPVALGITPDPDNEVHHQRIAILDSPAKDDAIVPAWVSGVCVARLNYTVDEGECATIGGHYLVNVKSGPVRILALGDTHASRLALVELSAFGSYREVVTAFEADEDGVRYKTQEVRVVGEKPASEWITLLEFAACGE